MSACACVWGSLGLLALSALTLNLNLSVLRCVAFALRTIRRRGVPLISMCRYLTIKGVSARGRQSVRVC